MSAGCVTELCNLGSHFQRKLVVEVTSVLFYSRDQGVYTVGQVTLSSNPSLLMLLRQCLSYLSCP